jgi:hypothetical protein
MRDRGGFDPAAVSSRTNELGIRPWRVAIGRTPSVEIGKDVTLSNGAIKRSTLES